MLKIKLYLRTTSELGKKNKKIAPVKKMTKTIGNNFFYNFHTIK